MTTDRTRFLGLTKDQFLGIVVTLLVVALAGVFFSIYRIEQLAAQGAQAHAANCNYKDYLYRQLEDSEHFLSLTPQQRVILYGKSLGNIPRSTILQSIAHEKGALHSLSKLQCN